MSDAPETTAPPMGDTQDDSAAIASAIEEISVAIATGLVAFLGQAINIYDTITCMLTLHDSRSPARPRHATRVEGQTNQDLSWQTQRGHPVQFAVRTESAWHRD